MQKAKLHTSAKEQPSQVSCAGPQHIGFITPLREQPNYVFNRLVSGQAETLSHREVLQFQRTVGNRSVQGLLQRTTKTTAISPPGQRTDETDMDVQTTTAPEEEVETARAERRRREAGSTQYRVSNPNDALEREADQVAAQISANPVNSELIAQKELNIERLEQQIRSSQQLTQIPDLLHAPSPGFARCQQANSSQIHVVRRDPGSSASDTVSPEVAARIQQTKGQGNPVPESVQRTMEFHTGHRFDQVRVKQDDTSASLCNALNARAFANGADVWLGKQESPHDVRLMSHELTHVVQHGAAPKLNADTTMRKVGLNPRCELSRHLYRMHTGGVTDVAYYREEINRFRQQHLDAGGSAQIKQKASNARLFRLYGGGGGVSFPTYNDIVADGDVQTATNQAWSNTKAATTTTTRREEGFWIRKNMGTGKFEFTTTIVGPTVNNSQGATIDLGSRPADTNPGSSNAVYTVASFHTHTPTTHRSTGRAVGPSGADNSVDRADDVTGVVYDYTATSGGNIPAGHPLNSAAQRYRSGRTRRQRL